MKKADRRKIITKTKQQNLYTEIELRKNVKPYVEIEKIFNIHYTADIKWQKPYEKKSCDGLLIDKRYVR